MNTHYALYSFKAEEKCGSCEYIDLNGNKVRVTAVFDSLKDANRYGWNDKIFIGKVKEYVPNSRFESILDYQSLYPII